MSKRPSLSATVIDLTKAHNMLCHIPADDRETWIQMGMVLKSEFNDDGFTLFDDWSATASNYDAKAVMSVWQSFKGGNRAMGSLIYTAKQHGWRPDKEPVERSMSKPKKPPPASTGSTSAYAKRLFLASNRDDNNVADHPYSIDKGMPSAFGAGRGKASGRLIGKNSDCIIVPIRTVESNRVQGVQCINSEGVKQTFGKVSGGALIIGNTHNLKAPWFVVEGWASAVSTVFHHNKEICACSFGKSNQDAVAMRISEFYNPDEIIILREIDA